MPLVLESLKFRFNETVKSKCLFFVQILDIENIDHPSPESINCVGGTTQTQGTISNIIRKHHQYMKVAEAVAPSAS